MTNERPNRIDVRHRKRDACHSKADVRHSKADVRHSKADVRRLSPGEHDDGRSRYCDTATSSGTSCMIPVCVRMGVERANEIVVDNGDDIQQSSN